MKKRRVKSLMRDRPGVIWLIGLALLGFIVAYITITSLHSAEKMAMVYVASETITSDTIITANEITATQISSSVVPAGAIQNPSSVVGKYADATIAKGEPILNSVVAKATTVRQLVRTFGMNYVGAAIELDQSDISISDINPGDILDLVGVYSTQNQQVYTQWIAVGVPVIAVDTTNSKVVLAIPREDALSLVRDITVGKVRVMLDPRPFRGVVGFRTKQSLTAALPKVGSESGAKATAEPQTLSSSKLLKNKTTIAKEATTNSSSKWTVTG